MLHMESNLPRRNVCEAFVRELTRFENEPGAGFQDLILLKFPLSIRVTFKFFLIDGEDPIFPEFHK